MNSPPQLTDNARPDGDTPLHVRLAVADSALEKRLRSDLLGLDVPVVLADDEAVATDLWIVAQANEQPYVHQAGSYAGACSLQISAEPAGREGNLADAHLPYDYTRRELQLTLRLLQTIARLRRREGEAARQHEALHEQALRDSLTQLANRRAWDQFAAEHWSAKARGCVAIVDVDYFKQVNDRLGQAGGDRVLRAVAEGLAAAVRAGDLVARIGGDEFGVVLSGVDQRMAAAVVRRLCEAASGSVNRLEANTKQAESQGAVTVSVGYAVGAAGAQSFEELYQQASEALRRAKQSGRDCSHNYANLPGRRA